MKILGTPDTVLLFFYIWGKGVLGNEIQPTGLLLFKKRLLTGPILWSSIAKRRWDRRDGSEITTVWLNCVLVLYQPKTWVPPRKLCQHMSTTYVRWGNEWRFDWQEPLQINVRGEPRGTPYRPIGPCLCRGNKELKLQKNRTQRFKMLCWSSGCPELVQLVKMVKLVKLVKAYRMLHVSHSKQTHIGSVQHLRA